MQSNADTGGNKAPLALHAEKLKQSQVGLLQFRCRTGRLAGGLKVYTLYARVRRVCAFASW